MNKSNAKKIAEIITYEQLTEMFNNAKKEVGDWKKVSIVNSCMTKGTAWNILYKGLMPRIMNQKLALTNMIREFGDHLPEELKFDRKVKIKSSVNITHQEPIF